MAKTKEFSEKADIYDSEYSRDKYFEYSKISSDYLAEGHYYMNRIDSIKLHFVPEVIGWQMTHSFRAKNLGGNFGLYRYLFVMDKKLTKVIMSKDLSKE